METNTLNLKEIAKHIDKHQTNAMEMDKVTIDNPSLTVEDAYKVQQLWSELAKERSDHMVGWKMGLTSKAKQESVGVNEPIYGRLTQSMEEHHSELNLKHLIHPKVEPEIAFVINKELKGDNLTPRDIWSASEMIMPALEVIDSRYKNFSFTLEDVVADNASSSKYFLSDQAYSPYHTNMSDLEVIMKKNGEVVEQGTGSAVLGHPVRSIVELARMLNRSGLSIRPGMVILTGGITAAVNVDHGDHLQVDFGPLGDMSLNVSN